MRNAGAGASFLETAVPWIGRGIAGTGQAGGRAKRGAAAQTRFPRQSRSRRREPRRAWNEGGRGDGHARYSGGRGGRKAPRGGPGAGPPGRKARYARRRAINVSVL